MYLAILLKVSKHLEKQNALYNILSKFRLKNFLNFERFFDLNINHQVSTNKYLVFQSKHFNLIYF